MVQHIIQPIVQPIVQHISINNIVNDDSNEDNDIVDTSSLNRFNLVVCELHNKYMHGFTAESDPNVQGHYLIIHNSTNHSIFRPLGTNANGEYIDSESDIENDSENDQYFDNINGIIEYYRHKYSDLLDDFNIPHNVFGPNKEHPLIRNYYTIISDLDKHIKPEIALKIYLSGGECVAILKTFWLRIIQRVWRKKYSQRTAMFNMRLRIESLNHRALTGKWPNHCLVLPTIHGMLHNIA